MNAWTVVPTKEATDREDVRLDCEVITGLMDRVLKQFPDVTVEDAFVGVRQSVASVCVMEWDLICLKFATTETPTHQPNEV